MEYEFVDPEQERVRYRRMRASAAEADAMFAELDAEQMQEAVKVSKRPGLELEADRMKEKAKQQRDRAAALHKLAGTKPADFDQDRVQYLRDFLVNMENRHVQETEHIENQKVYGTDVTQHEYAVVEIEAGLKVLREKYAAMKEDA